MARRALAVDADNGGAHALLAAVLARQGRATEAIEHFERALELGRDTAGLRLGYSGALETLGRKDEAEVQLNAYRRMR